MSGYPKLIWLTDGREATVQNESELRKLVAEGVYVEPPAAGEPVPVTEEPEPELDEPTFGAPGDPTHVKRSRKKP